MEYCFSFCLNDNVNRGKAGSSQMLLTLRQLLSTTPACTGRPLTFFAVDMTGLGWRAGGG